MLPQKNRITRNNFPGHKVQGFPNQQIRALGEKFFNPYFSGVYYRISDKNVKESRVSVVVSKKTAKTAVSRNLLRRRFYEIFGVHINTLENIVTIVIYPKKEAEKAKFSVLKIEVEKALKQAKLLK